MTSHVTTDFTKGWFIGNFEPSLLKTDDCEVSVRDYESGDVETPHYHKVAKEFTVILSGEFQINGTTYSENAIIVFEPGEVSHFSCLTKGKTLVVKVPCVAGDKYLV